MHFSFGKDKKLKSRKRIENLFESGKRIKKFPISAVYFLDETKAPEYKIAVSVPKRYLKKAVDRNLIKRRIREAFRLNQSQLNPSQKLEVMFIYSSPEVKDYAVIEKSILSLISALNEASLNYKST